MFLFVVVLQQTNKNIIEIKTTNKIFFIYCLIIVCFLLPLTGNALAKWADKLDKKFNLAVT